MDCAWGTSTLEVWGDGARRVWIARHIANFLIYIFFVHHQSYGAIG